MANSAATDLAAADSADEIRQAMQNFSTEAAQSREIAQGLIAHTTYWVYDPQRDAFGPSKFVGFRDMDFARYAMAREGRSLGDPFDGHPARLSIEKVLAAAYMPDSKLSAALPRWVESLFPDSPGILAGVDSSKWKFLSLPGKAKAEPWSDDEIAKTVDSYMEMLHAELAGDRYNKTERRNALLKQLPLRNAPAVEFKHGNISAILHSMGRPYIDGYKPRGNYQAALKSAIEEYLAVHPNVTKALHGGLDAPVNPPPDGSKLRIEDIEVPPPEGSPEDVKRKNRPRTARKTDWAANDAVNRKLGTQGEQFVFDLERHHLTEIGHPELAARVEWTARDRGDGTGYDIRSFDEHGGEKYIEVKTTNGPKSMPFLISAAELECGGELKGCYWIYRLFRFGTDLKLYRICGTLEDCLELRPKVFVATVR